MDRTGEPGSTLDAKRFQMLTTSHEKHEKKLVCGRTQTETSYAAATPRRRRQLEAEDGTSLLFSTGPFLIDCRQLLVISLFCASALRGCLDSVASHGLILFLSCTLFFLKFLWNRVTRWQVVERYGFFASVASAAPFDGIWFLSPQKGSRIQMSGCQYMKLPYLLLQMPFI